MKSSQHSGNFLSTAEVIVSYCFTAECGCMGDLVTKDQDTRTAARLHHELQLMKRDYRENKTERLQGVLWVYLIVDILSIWTDNYVIRRIF